MDIELYGRCIVPVRNSTGTMIKKAYILLILFLALASSTSAQLRIDRYLITGRQQLGKSEFSDALKTFNHIIRVQDDNWEAWYYRGLTKFYLGDESGSERDFDKAIFLQPNLAEIYLYRGIVHDYKGNHYKALEDFNKGLTLNPEDPVLHYSRGTTYLRLNNFTRAIEDFDIAVEQNPRMDDAFLNRGIAKAKLLDMDGAFLDFNEAIMLNPFSGKGHQRKGLLFYEMRNFSEALVSFSEAIQKDSLDESSLYARALTWDEVDRKDSCLVDLNRVVGLNPRHAAALYNRALVKSQMEDFNGAINDYELVNDLFPNHVLSYFNRGIIWYQKGDNQASIEDLSEAIRLYPDFAKAYLARASVYQAMGNLERAQTDRMSAQDRIVANQGKTQDDLALNYADTTIQFEELISLNSNFMRSFSSLAESAGGKEFDPIGFIRINKSGVLVHGRNTELPAYHQLGINIKYPDFDPEKLSGFESLASVLQLSSIKKYNEAIEILNGSIESDNMKAPSLLLRALIRHEMIQFVMQTGVIKEVVPLQLGNDQAYSAGDFTNQVDYSEVLADYSQLIDLCPELPAAWYNRALIKMFSMNFIGSEQDFLRALKLDPQFAEAWFNLGILRLYANEKGVKIEGSKNDGCLDLSRAGELGLTKAYGVIKKLCKDI